VVPLRTDTASPETPDLDLVIFSGGADISTSWYTDSGAAVPIRDTAERAYFSHYHGRTPILGICRGMQLINCLLGGSLIQDLKEAAGYFPHKDGEHNIIFESGSMQRVNSFHHQSVDRVGNNLRVLAKSGDNVIEVMDGPGLYLVQFHPERMKLDEYSMSIIKNML
jgi:putative glutamine amidotransferase